MIIKYSILAEFIASLATSIIAYILVSLFTNQTEDLDFNSFGLLLII